MRILNPRSSALASNLSPSDNCAFYSEDEGQINITLPENLDNNLGIEFIHMIFESDSG